MEEEKKKLFGRGIYGSKDVPIRILDGLIVGMILLAVVLTVIFSINGGYRVTFDTRGGGEIPYQKLRYGKLVEFPTIEDADSFTPPDWFGEDVTFSGLYQNSRLSNPHKQP